MVTARRAALMSGVAVAAVMIQTGRATLFDSTQRTPVTQAGSQESVIVGVDGR
jgi:hypothetical protein